MTADAWWLQRQERRVTPGTLQIERLSTWLQRPKGDIGPGGWLVLLQPEHIDASLRLPEGSFHKTTTLRWTSPPTGASFDVVVEPVWVARHEQSSELAIDVHARCGGTTIATCRSTYRLPGSHRAFGERITERPPPPPERPSLNLRLTLDDRQVDAFSEISSTRDRIHDDPAYAHRQGFSGVIVQGVLLAATVMHHARPRPEGTARFWYQRPVPAGTLLRLERGQAEGSAPSGCWAIRKPVGDVAVIAQIESPEGSEATLPTSRGC